MKFGIRYIGKEWCNIPPALCKQAMLLYDTIAQIKRHADVLAPWCGAECVQINNKLSGIGTHTAAASTDLVCETIAGS